METCAPFRIFSSLTAIILCFGPLLLWGQNTSQVSAGYSYHEDIVPLIQRRCMPCHAKDGQGPFALDSYEALQKHGAQIQAVVRDGFMPPWPADTLYRHFRNENVLSSTERKAIENWVAEGMPEGQRKRKGLGCGNHGKNQKLPRPAVVLQAAAPYVVPADGQDHFVYTLIGEPLKQDLEVAGFRFLPGNLRVVHHTELLVAAPEAVIPEGVLVMDESNYSPAHFDSVMGRGFRYITGWLPGNQGEFYPEDFGIRLKKGSRLVMMVHYTPTAVVETDWTKLEIFDRKVPPLREMISLDLHGQEAIVNGPLVLPADSVVTFEARLKLRQDFSVMAIFPHAHHLCVSMRAFARTEEGDTIPLLNIPKWDFDWQFTYELPRMLKLPSGATVHFFATYDNTSANPENPFDPPREVHSSFRSVDEMMELFLWGVPYLDGDEDLELDFGKFSQ